MKKLGNQDQMSSLHYFLLVNGWEIERRGEMLQTKRNGINGDARDTQSLPKVG
jgi:hypothetical protein